MMDLAVITTTVARDRVAEQFARRAEPASASNGRIRRAALRALGVK